MRERSCYQRLCSVFILSALALFLFLLRYDVPLYGDDVGWLVLNDPDSSYFDAADTQGECVLNLDYSVGMAWEKIRYAYTRWDGRVISRALMPVVRLIFSLPDGINWILFSLYIMMFLMTLLLVVIRTISGKIIDGLKTPGIIVLTAVLLYMLPEYSYAYMTRLIMYVFTNIYVCSVILYLVFYGIIRGIYEQPAKKQPPAVKTLFGINLIGLLAGLSHEAYGVIFGAVLLTQLTRFWLQNHRRISVRYLFMYAGYLVGFCICFFAPGNFSRAQQSHEAALWTVPLMERLFNSIYIHAFVGYKIWIMPFVVFPVLFVLFVLLFRKRLLSGKDILTVLVDNLEWFLGFLMSVITWGLVARVMNYGMLAANVLLVIGVTRVFLELWKLVTERVRMKEGWTGRIRNVFAGVSIIIVILIVSVHYTDMSSVHQIGSEWRENIRVARKVGMEEITVPAYPEDLDSRFYDLNIINDQSRYDKAACLVVYGTHLVIK